MGERENTSRNHTVRKGKIHPKKPKRKMRSLCQLHISFFFFFWGYFLPKREKLTLHKLVFILSLR